MDGPCAVCTGALVRAHSRYSEGQSVQLSWCQEQNSTGASLAIHSVSTFGQEVEGRRPDVAQTGARSTPGGGSRIGPSVMARPFIAASITEWKIWPAPVTPLELRSSVRSKLPTQTPTVTSRV